MYAVSAGTTYCQRRMYVPRAASPAPTNHQKKMEASWHTQRRAMRDDRRAGLQ